MEEDLKTSAKGQILSIRDLPTLPKVLEEVSKLVQNPNTSIEAIAKVISRDQVLSAKVLKLANSAFFGFSRKVGSLTQALMLLGFDVVKGLILTSSVFDMMKDRDQGLWEHSMGVATASSLIAQQVDLPDAEEASLGGLLHDLGKVVLRAQMTEDMQSIVELVEVEGMSIRQAEQEVLGFDHSHIGMWLAESWKLPEELMDPIRWHHQPEGARKAPLLTAVVHLADIMVRGYGHGDGGDPWVPELDRGALKLLNLTPQKLERVVDGICEKLVNTGGDMPPH